MYHVAQSMPFRGDEKDVVLFSLALTEQTGQGTYDWLKNNKELINVATSRAKEQVSHTLFIRKGSKMILKDRTK